MRAAVQPESTARGEPMSDSIVVPKFATEAEEADWWFDNREEHDELMGQAMEEGRTITLKEYLARRGLELPKVSVHLDPADINIARQQAEARGIDTESYLQELVHEAVTAAR